MEAVRLVKYREWSTRKAARYTGFSQSAIVKWCGKDPTGGWRRIETESSRPHTHPRALAPALVDRIVSIRHETKRCAEIIHRMLVREGYQTSLSSVKRTLKRNGFIPKRDGRKRWHFSAPRPYAEKPGDLVQIDTIHIVKNKILRLYVFTLLDLHSRWAYAKAYLHARGATSLAFVREAQTHAPFAFGYLQSDHGSEFSRYFQHMIGIQHRHSRVRKPNDNAHLERFNRTIQEECLDRLPKDVEAINEALPAYLDYYNTKRLHMGINFKTPAEVITSY
jgi:transposase InsO family protein